MIDNKFEKNELDSVIERIKGSLPHPIAFQINKYINNRNKTNEDEWLILCDKIFIETIKLLSYILLSELAAYEIKIGKIYYHIENILSRPLGGNYVGFLREATLELKKKNITPLSHQIVDFIYDSEIKKVLHPKSKALLNEILNYRNSISHGGVTPSIAKREIGSIRRLFAIFLNGLSFFKDIKLVNDKGHVLNGSDLKLTVADSITTYAKFSDNTKIRMLPLLLSYKENKLLLLSDFDAKNIKIHYQGQESYEIFSKKYSNKNFVQDLYLKLVELLDRVRALNAPQNSFERTRFDERIKIITDITLTSYSYMGIYNSQNPMLYCVPDGFNGPNNKLDSFLQSDKNLLVISKNKGGGKSAFCAYCCDNLLKREYSVFFINGIDFTNINPKWQENPFYRLFSSSLNYNCDLNKKNVKKLVNKSEKELVFIIDEVDNISRIDEKWNKLRAIDDLLNWIDDVAQPGIKFIVSLNLEEYKKFNWLSNQDFEDKEIPISSNILSISYLSNSAEDQWVHYLGDFTIQNAKILYNNLQEEESLNMRPNLSWEDFLSKHEHQIKDLVDSPLKFLNYLRALNNRSDINNPSVEKTLKNFFEKITNDNTRLTIFKKLIRFASRFGFSEKLFLLIKLKKLSQKYGGEKFLISQLKKNEKTEFDKIVNKSKYTDLVDSKLIIDYTFKLEKLSSEDTKHSNNLNKTIDHTPELEKLSSEDTKQSNNSNLPNDHALESDNSKDRMIKFNYSYMEKINYVTFKYDELSRYRILMIFIILIYSVVTIWFIFSFYGLSSDSIAATSEMSSLKFNNLKSSSFVLLYTFILLSFIMSVEKSDRAYYSNGVDQVKTNIFLSRILIILSFVILFTPKVLTMTSTTQLVVSIIILLVLFPIISCLSFSFFTNKKLTVFDKKCTVSAKLDEFDCINMRKNFYGFKDVLKNSSIKKIFIRILILVSIVSSSFLLKFLNFSEINDPYIGLQLRNLAIRNNNLFIEGLLIIGVLVIIGDVLIQLKISNIVNYYYYRTTNLARMRRSNKAFYFYPLIFILMSIGYFQIFLIKDEILRSNYKYSHSYKYKNRMKYQQIPNILSEKELKYTLKNISNNNDDGGYFYSLNLYDSDIKQEMIEDLIENNLVMFLKLPKKVDRRYNLTNIKNLWPLQFIECSNPNVKVITNKNIKIIESTSYTTGGLIIPDPSNMKPIIFSDTEYLVRVLDNSTTDKCQKISKYNLPIRINVVSDQPASLNWLPNEPCEHLVKFEKLPSINNSKITLFKRMELNGEETIQELESLKYFTGLENLVLFDYQNKSFEYYDKLIEAIKTLPKLRTFTLEVQTLDRETGKGIQYPYLSTNQAIEKLLLAKQQSLPVNKDLRFSDKHPNIEISNNHISFGETPYSETIINDLKISYDDRGGNWIERLYINQTIEPIDFNNIPFSNYIYYLEIPINELQRVPNDFKIETLALSGVNHENIQNVINIIKNEKYNIVLNNLSRIKLAVTNDSNSQVFIEIRELCKLLENVELSFCNDRASFQLSDDADVNIQYLQNLYKKPELFFGE